MIERALQRRAPALTVPRLELWHKAALLVLLSLGIIGLTLWMRPQLSEIGPWGYPFGFGLSLMSSASIVPSAGFGAVLVLAQDSNAVLLGLAAGAGLTIGELTGYWIGAQGKSVLKNTRFNRAVTRYMHRYGGGTIFVSALMPLIPVDAAGFLAGSTTYPVRRFLFYMALGKIPMTIAVLWASTAAVNWAGPVFGWAY